MSGHRTAVLFLTLAVIWGVAFAAISAGLAYLPPVLFAAIRYDVAGVLVLAYAAWRVEYWRPRTRADLLSVLVGGTVIIAAYNALLFVGQQSVTAAVAAVVIATNPILATGFARGLLPAERLSLPGIVGLLIGLLGVGFVARPDPSNLLASDVVGTLFVLGAAVSVALGSVLVQRLDPAISTEGMTGWSNLLGALCLHLVSLGLPGESVAAAVWSVEALFALAYLAILASAVGYLIYFELLSRVGSIQVTLISYATPVFAALGGYVWVGETIDLATVGGFSLICVGFALVKRRAIRAEAPRIAALLSK
ncbi:DMT family transporter [Natronorarus salvus]|uniref:DMT family transporter n=1 Tax=Natronorarus salvus TaxID=3117733 RepID=UPI002F25F1F7